MKTLEQQMAFYAAYHRNRWNRLTHFVAGHVFEGRKPALTDNLFQIFVAPIFLAAEVAFALGLRRDTQLEVERLSHQHD